MSPSALKDEPNEAYNSTSLPPVNILISHKQTSDRNSRNNSFVAIRYTGKGVAHIPLPFEAIGRIRGLAVTVPARWATSNLRFKEDGQIA